MLYAGAGVESESSIILDGANFSGFGVLIVVSGWRSLNGQLCSLECFVLLTCSLANKATLVTVPNRLYPRHQVFWLSHVLEHLKH